MKKNFILLFLLLFHIGCEKEDQNEDNINSTSRLNIQKSITTEESPDINLGFLDLFGTHYSCNTMDYHNKKTIELNYTLKGDFEPYNIYIKGIYVIFSTNIGASYPYLYSYYSSACEEGTTLLGAENFSPPGYYISLDATKLPNKDFILQLIVEYVTDNPNFDKNYKLASSNRCLVTNNIYGYGKVGSESDASCKLDVSVPFDNNLYEIHIGNPVFKDFTLKNESYSITFPIVSGRSYSTVVEMYQSKTSEYKFRTIQIPAIPAGYTYTTSCNW